jgi:hypothetical protein
VGDGFDKAHERFEELGRLQHSVADCPDVRGPVETRVWTPDRGWERIAIPVDPVSLVPGQ